MIAYLLFCILCVLLGMFIGSSALWLWGIGTVFVIAMEVFGDLFKLLFDLCGRGLNAFENWLASKDI